MYAVTFRGGALFLIRLMNLFAKHYSALETVQGNHFAKVPTTG